MSQSTWGTSFDRFGPSLLELLSGVRKLPGISADTLSDEAKAVLLVVIGYRHQGGVSKTRIGDILKLDPSPLLDLLWKRELVLLGPGKGTFLVAPHPAGAAGLRFALLLRYPRA